MAVHWWVVSPSPKWRESDAWLEHAQRSTLPFGENTAGTLWRHAKRPALCGALPPDGVWSSVGGPWGPYPGRTPPSCPTCLRRMGG